MSDGGKGSAPRPYSVDKQTFDTNWEAIFGRKIKGNDNDDEKQDGTSPGATEAEAQGSGTGSNGS